MGQPKMHSFKYESSVAWVNQAYENWMPLIAYEIVKARVLGIGDHLHGSIYKLSIPLTYEDVIVEHLNGKVTSS